MDIQEGFLEFSLLQPRGKGGSRSQATSPVDQAEWRKPSMKTQVFRWQQVTWECEGPGKMLYCAGQMQMLLVVPEPGPGGEGADQVGHP